MGVIMKFGGTSISSIDKMNSIAQHIKDIRETEKDIVLVVSAMGKSTDDLIKLAKQLSDDLPHREVDALLATGEQQTIALLSIALKSKGVDAISLTGFQAGFITTDSHTKGIIKDIDISRVQKHLDDDKVVVVAGFQGITSSGDITTLGRGGSDTSAVALAAKLNFACEIYTDVSGIYTVDPHIFKQAKKLDKVSFEEMMEMAALGAGVIETRSVELAKKFDVSLYIAKSLSEKGSGTYIMNEENLFEEKPITGISVKDDVSMISIDGIKNDVSIVSRIFDFVTEKNLNLDMISQSFDEFNRIRVSFSLDTEDLATFNECVNEHDNFLRGYTITTSSNLVKISLVGVGMATNFGVASKVFNVLSSNNINFYHVSTSEISISCTIKEKNKIEAVELLAKAFNL